MGAPLMIVGDNEYAVIVTVTLGGQIEQIRVRWT